MKRLKIKTSLSNNNIYVVSYMWVVLSLILFRGPNSSTKNRLERIFIQVITILLSIFITYYYYLNPYKLKLKTIVKSKRKCLYKNKCDVKSICSKKS